MTLAERYAVVRERIRRAAERSGRSPGEVRLVAVSKTFPADAVAAAARLGITDFGENRAQELVAKAGALGKDRALNTRLVWHFVGPLQTNKIRHVVGLAALVHSVDRLEVAEGIARRARALGRMQDVLIEVNVGREPTKHGVEPAGLVELARAVHDIDGLALRGVMAIPPDSPDAEGARRYFKEMAALRDELAATWPGARELSIGMSRDLEVAIEEGATIVRVGEALFGPRPASR
ncbi:MAG: YggS family pyridoxal phosphate-dependent enzyme [Actinomycetota bacterium]